MRNEHPATSGERPGLTPDQVYWLSKRPGSNKWHRTWFDTGARQTRRESLSTSDLSTAHEALAVWWAANRGLVKEAPSTVTVATVLQRYYNKHAISIASEEQARIACAKLTDHSGKLAVSEFSPKRQREFQDWMNTDGYSAGYIRRTLGVAKSAFAWASREELITHAPKIVLPEDGPPRDRVLSFEEVQALWFATERDHERMFLALAFCTLGRPEALLDVTREMANFERGILEPNPPGRKQTKKYRATVPIVPELRPWIESAPPGILVRWRGQSINSFKTAWRAIRARARLDKNIVPKTIRHTMATEMRTNGVSEADIQGFLGHRAYGGRTEVYAKYRPEYLDHAARVVNDYMVNLRSTCVAGD